MTEDNVELGKRLSLYQGEGEQGKSERKSNNLSKSDLGRVGMKIGSGAKQSLEDLYEGMIKKGKSSYNHRKDYLPIELFMNVIGFEARPDQKFFLKSFFEEKNLKKYVLRLHRRAGKSHIMAVMIVYFAIFVKETSARHNILALGESYTAWNDAVGVHLRDILYRIFKDEVAYDAIDQKFFVPNIAGLITTIKFALYPSDNKGRKSLQGGRATFIAVDEGQKMDASSFSRQVQPMLTEMGLEGTNRLGDNVVRALVTQTYPETITHREYWSVVERDWSIWDKLNPKRQSEILSAGATRKDLQKIPSYRFQSMNTQTTQEINDHHFYHGKGRKETKQRNEYERYKLNLRQERQNMTDEEWALNFSFEAKDIARDTSMENIIREWQSYDISKDKGKAWHKVVAYFDTGLSDATAIVFVEFRKFGEFDYRKVFRGAMQMKNTHITEVKKVIAGYEVKQEKGKCQDQLIGEYLMKHKLALVGCVLPHDSGNRNLSASGINVLDIMDRAGLLVASKMKQMTINDYYAIMKDKLKKTYYTKECIVLKEALEAIVIKVEKNGTNTIVKVSGGKNRHFWDATILALRGNKDYHHNPNTYKIRQYHDISHYHNNDKIFIMNKMIPFANKTTIIKNKNNSILQQYHDLGL